MAVASAQMQEESDARLAIGVAAFCSTGLAVYVLMPYAVAPEQLPPGLDLVWMFGSAAVLLLGPVAAGLAGWASLVVLWVRGEALTTRARRTHLVTLLLVATYAVMLALLWSAGVLDWFSD